MKKFAMAAVAAAAMSVGVAQAYTVGTFTNGVVVPNVIHNGAGDTTAVGLISDTGGCVYWTFFDQDSTHVKDGVFAMTANDFQGFVWADTQYSGVGLNGQRGYLVFTMSDENPSPAGKCPQATALTAGSATRTLAGNAFHVDAAAKDVAFVPVIDGPLTFDGVRTLNNMNANSLVQVGGALTLAGADSAKLYMRYYIDGATGGTDTNVVVWSTGDQRGQHTVYMFNDKQDQFSVNFKLAHSELDYFDVESIPGRDPSYLDGFLLWPVDRTTFTLNKGTVAAAVPTTVSVITYSVISAPAFGAVQTVLGAHKQP